MLTNRALPLSFFDRPYLLLSLTSLFWAINIVLGRYAANDIPPATFAFLRWAGAGAIILPFAWRGLIAEQTAIRRHIVILTVLACTGVGCYNALAYWGLKYTEALNALLIQSIGPLLMALWGFALWRDKLTLWQFLAILTSLVGVIVILTRGDVTKLSDMTFNVGDILTFLALVIYGFYAALLRKRPTIKQSNFLAVSVIIGSLFLMPFAAGEFAAGHRINLTWETAAILGYVMLFPSLLGHLFFTRGVQLIGTNRASPFFHLMPAFGSVIAILFLGERLQSFHAVGFVLVLGGVFAATRTKYRKPMPLMEDQMISESKKT